MQGDGYTIVQRDGLAVAVADPQPPCSRCGGKGRREVEVDGVRRIGRCRCQMLPDRVAMFNAMRVPARHAHCSLGTFRVESDSQRLAVELVRALIERVRSNDERSGLVLYGAPGRGKTHLAVAAARELIFGHGIPARFVEFSHLLSDIREGIGRNDPEATTLAPYISPPVLIIDELGKGRKTDFELSVLDEIVSRRYNARGALVATTNFPLRPPTRKPSDTHAPIETLPERLGDRIFSRLQETVRWVGVEGDDFRVTRGRSG
jgi:DNA replication protein DnaC